MKKLIECVPNISEGRDQGVIDAVTAVVGEVDGVHLLDVDPGADTNRTVITFVGSPADAEEAAFRAEAYGWLEQNAELKGPDDQPADALGERTTRIQMGTSVVTPTFRYPPSIIAQAMGTLGALNPGRVMLGVGTGESLNDVPATGMTWPPFKERFGRLPESVAADKGFCPDEDTYEEMEELVDYHQSSAAHE